MYRNTFFDRKKSIVHHWGYDDNGMPSKYEVPFLPYLYIPTVNKKAIEAYGIDGVALEKKTFDNEYDRKRFAENAKHKIYFNLPPTQQYLLEKYHNMDIKELTQYPLRTFFFDIEVVADEFPNADEAKFPINAITIYDTQTKKYHVWGTGSHDSSTIEKDIPKIKAEDVIYSDCKDEKELLRRFLAFWVHNFPDVIVGYNSYSFDMPYIVHRIRNIFGEGKERLLSPVRNVYGIKKTNKFKQEYTEYFIGGISHIDYMILFKTFTPGERESDSLDFICWDEIGVGKLDYGDLSLKDLKEKHWNKFINYNIWDVSLMLQLDEKKKYLAVARFSACIGFCNLDKAFGKTAIITGVLAKQSLQKGKIIPTQMDGEHERIPGGYVKTPQPGLYEDVTSFDANSLYPSIMITLNVSPEKKIAKIISETDTDYMISVKDKDAVAVPKNKLYEILKKKNWSISSSGVMFDQNEKGIASEFVDGLYQQRKVVQSELRRLESIMNDLSPECEEYKDIKFKSEQLDTEQYLYKILLNSTYGAFANRFFPLYDIDCAKSITTTGQAMIKATEKFANDFIVEHWNLAVKDRVAGMDTDSLILTIKDICELDGTELMNSTGDLTPEFIKIENIISEHINTKIKEWAIETLNSSDPRFFFKRESVCPKAIWVGKKNYILYIINKEGKKMDRFKYSGLRIAKSTWSNTVRDLAKEIVKVIMMHKDKKQADALIFKAFDEFRNLSINDVAERGSVKVLNKWEGKNDGFSTAKGTTGNAKYAIYHNELLKELNLQNKYRKIENGSKIKMVMVNDNMYNLAGIAYQDMFPQDFPLTVNYENMFFKGLLKCLEPIYISMNWKIPDPQKQYENTVEDIFG